MANLVLPLREQEKKMINEFSWINWSELARKEIIKKLIFENFIKSRGISNEEWKFCEANDWHPVDWLPLKKSFIKKIERAKKEPSIKLKSISEIFN